MSEVTLSIGNRHYTIACADGQEDHVQRLGALIDAKLAALGDNLASQEAQNLLFAALHIAEDHHQLKNTLTADKGELDTLREALAAVEREKAAAMGQHDQLNATIAEREAELEGLQTAQQRVAKDMDEIRSEVTRLRSDIESSEQVEAELRAGLAGLVEERDALQQELEELRAAAATPAAAAGQAVDPELAPALERFADLLENCADKLEGTA